MNILTQKVLTYIKGAGEVIDALQKESRDKTQTISALKAAKEAAEKQASEKTPEVFDTEKIASTVDLLVEADMITEADREKVASGLQSRPEKSLEVLSMLAQKDIDSRVKRIGKTKKRQEKTASTDSDRESDRAWTQMMTDLERNS